MWKIAKVKPKLDNSLDTTESYIPADLYEEDGMSPLMGNESDDDLEIEDLSWNL